MFYKFSRAIVRSPSPSVVNGLSEAGIKPNYQVLSNEHSNYVKSLKSLGLKRDTYTISSKVFDNLKNLYATGATQISLNNEGLSKIYVPYPNEEKVLEFCNIVNPIIDKSILLKNINKNLIETRDYLLPKLISGKVDVSDLDIDTSILDE